MTKKHISIFLSFVMIFNIVMSNIPMEVFAENIYTYSDSDIYKYNFESGKSYELYNKGEEILKFNTTDRSSKYDLVIYDKDGNVINIYNNKSSYFNIGAKQKVAISIKDDNIDFNIPIGEEYYIDYKEVESPALYELKLKKGVNYHIINTMSNSTYMQSENSNRKYDIVNYDKDNKVKSFYLNNGGSSKIDGKGSIKIKARNDDNIFYIPYNHYEDLNIVELDEIFYTQTFEKDKNYEIRNETNQNIEFKTEETIFSTHDMVTYYSDDSVRSIGISVDPKINLSQGNYCRLTMKKQVTMSIPLDLKEMVDINESATPALYRFKLENNKNYEIKNTNKESIYLQSETTLPRQDKVFYNKDNSIKLFDQDSSSRITLLADEKLKTTITGSDVTWCVPYDYKEGIIITEIKEPALYKFSFEPGKNYKVYNNTDKYIQIKRSNTHSLYRYDMIHYKEDLTYKYISNTYSNIELYKGEYAIISASSKNSGAMHDYVPFDLYKEGLIVEDSSQHVNDVFDIIPKINLQINKYISREIESSDIQKINDLIENYSIRVANKTQNKNLNYTRKGNYIVFSSSDVKSGDVISIKLSSKFKDSEDVSVEVKLDSNRQGNATFDVTQLGGIKINKTDNLNQNIKTRALLYDNEGKYIGVNQIVDNKEQIISYLSEGKYTLILLKSNGALWQINSLSEFGERGLIEGTDYIKYNVYVKDGIINKLNINNVPVLDEDRISFFDGKNTMLSTSSDSATTDGLIEVRLQYDFKDIYSKKDLSKIKFSFSIPKHVHFVEDSVLLNNKKTEYTYEKSMSMAYTHDELTVPANDLSGVIKFYVKGVEVKKSELSAEASFSYKSKSIKESIGRQSIEVSYITLDGVKETNTKTINVYGIAPAKGSISIYDGNTKVGETRALLSGKWSKEITLKNAYNGSTHKLVAKLNEGKESEAISNELKVKYETKSPVIKKVTLIYRNKKYDITSSILEGKRNHIILYPGDVNFTFIVEVENSDAIDELYITSNKNGDKSKLKAKYDTKEKVWIASGSFTHFNQKYPGSISIDYRTNGSFLSVGKIDFASKEFHESLPDEIKNSNVNVIESTEDSSKIEVILGNKENSKINVSANSGKFNPNIITKQELKNKGYFSIDEDTWAKIDKDAQKISIEIFKFTTSEMFNLYLGDNAGGLLSLLTSYGSYEEEVATLNQMMIDYPQHAQTLKALSIINDGILVVAVICAVFGGFALGGPLYIGPLVSILAGLGTTLTAFLSSISKDIIKGESSIPFLLKWLIDPSGYVYEAVDSNRVQGATATVYYKDEETGQAIKWDAEEFDQINPLITDEQGKYAWDVPEGLWQVKYEKEGYETAYSEWLPVPPPQTEVNIGLVSKEKPSIELFNIYKDKAEITFNKYMDVSTINSSSIKLTDSKGSNVAITIEPVDSKISTDNKNLAKKFILKSSTTLSGTYNLTVKNTAKTYAGVNSTSDIIEKATYKELPTEINVLEEYKCVYGKTINIPVSINKIANASDFEIIATSSMDEIARVSNQKIKLNSEGKGTIQVLGQLPGEATITLVIEGTDLVKETKINITLPDGDDSEIEIPNTLPIISANDVVIKLGDKFNPKSHATANDEEDGDLTSSIEVIENTVNISKPGDYNVTYKVSDSNEESSTKTINVKVNNVFIDFTVNNIDSKSTTITGKGVGGAKVEAYVGSTKIGNTGTVNSSGNYSITIPVQKANTNIIVKMSKSGYEIAQKTIKVIPIASGAKKILTNDIYKYDAGKGKYLTYINGKGYSQFVYLNKSGNYAFTPSSWMVAAGLSVSMPTSTNGYTMTVDNNYIGLYNDAKLILDNIKANKISKAEIKAQLDNLENNQKTAKTVSKAAPNRTLSTDIYKYDAGKGKFVTYINGKGYSQFVYLNKSGNYAFTPSSWMVAAGLTVTMPTSSNGYTMKINNPYISKYNNVVNEIKSYI